MSETTEPEFLFFLGAGASVAAGVSDTFNLVNDFLRDLETTNREKSKLEQCKKILEILEKSELASDGKVDVELLLEALDQLENINECIPLSFFRVNECVLGSDMKSHANYLKKKLQDFIKKTGLVGKDDVKYLKDLLLFIEERPHKPLDIFSVNYDICIEQFCETFEKEYVDGFYLKWEPSSLKRQDVDVRLHKIHGSIIWYQTDRGSYVKLPIQSKEAQVELTTGEKASTLILYPMRKLEYTVPLMDLLMILKEKLSRVKFAFVVGYSFRDNQIRQIFWNAAKKNKELILILVSPSAQNVYEKRLRNYEKGIPSELEGRVICLPYKFEKALPLLKNLYLKGLKQGLNQEKGCNDQENQGATDVPWEACMLPFVNCEYVDKIKWILQKGAWEKFIEGKVLSYVIETAFKAFLTSLISNDDSYQSIWVRKLNNTLSKIFTVDNLNVELPNIHFEDETRSWTEIVIRPIFRAKDQAFHFATCSELIQFMQQECQLKISLMKEEQATTLADVRRKLDRMQKYFGQFPKGQITLSKYLATRKERYPTLDKDMYSKDKDGHPVIIDRVLVNIERQELKEIFDGSQLSFGED